MKWVSDGGMSLQQCTRLHLLGVFCSLILGSVAVSRWLGSSESANFWLKRFKITCVCGICATPDGVSAGMRSATWLEICHLLGMEALIAL